MFSNSSNTFIFDDLTFIDTIKAETTTLDNTPSTSQTPSLESIATNTISNQKQRKNHPAGNLLKPFNPFLNYAEIEAKNAFDQLLKKSCDDILSEPPTYHKSRKRYISSPDFALEKSRKRKETFDESDRQIKFIRFKSDNVKEEKDMIF